MVRKKFKKEKTLKLKEGDYSNCEHYKGDGYELIINKIPIYLCYNCYEKVERQVLKQIMVERKIGFVNHQIKDKKKLVIEDTKQ